MAETEDQKRTEPSKVPKNTKEAEANVSDVETDEAAGEIVRGEGDDAHEEPLVEVDSGPDTDKAVDDIVREEADDELRAQDEAAGEAVVMKLSRWERFKNFQSNWWGDPRKKWGTIAVIVVLIGTLFAVSFTRYEILGLYFRGEVTVQAVDSKTGAPVSGVQVRVADVEADTNAEGKAVLSVHTGRRHLQVSKKYYRGSSQTVLVALSPGSNKFKAKLVALGRQVKVQVVNKITGKPIESAKVTAGGANAKTDKNGQATVVLPSGATTQQADVSVGGYNTATVTINAGGNLAKNTFSVTPSGKLYFLSNLSGTIDVVKTNLDGTDRQTVLAGTGNEDPNSTSLLASHDWKYLALLSKRSGSSPSLYLIDTTNGDKLTTIDEGNATFTPIGWSNDLFAYEVDRGTAIADGQPDQQSLKSFNPVTGHTLVLDNTQASVGQPGSYAKQLFGPAYIMGGQVVYTKDWEGTGLDPVTGVDVGAQITLNGKQPELDSINADGSNHQVVKSFTPSTYPDYHYIGDLNISTVIYGPNSLYIQFPDGASGSQYYSYDSGKIASVSVSDMDSVDSVPPATYLLSPSGKQNFWAAQSNGQNALFTGDENGNGQKQITTSSDYSPYAWYTDSYLLVSKSSSELYIMSASGGTPLKIADYYKPAVDYSDYGGF